MKLDLQYFGGRGSSIGAGGGGGAGSRTRATGMKELVKKAGASENAGARLKTLQNQLLKFLKAINSKQMDKVKDWRFTVYKDGKRYLFDTRGKEAVARLADMVEEIGGAKGLSQISYVRFSDGKSTVDSLVGRQYGGPTEQPWTPYEQRTYHSEVRKTFEE